jgi:hypothetical protein
LKSSMASLVSPDYLVATSLSLAILSSVIFVGP